MYINFMITETEFYKACTALKALAKRALISLDITKKLNRRVRYVINRIVENASSGKNN